MNGDDKRANELSDLASRIEQFDRSQPQRDYLKRPRERKRSAISPRERKIRRWIFALMAVWGCLVYALIMFQGWGSFRLWELILAGPFVALCVVGCYGFYLFYAELGKSALRMIRGGKKSD